MFPDEEVAEAEVVETEVQTEGDKPQYDAEVVKKAESMGWVSPDKWKGEPPKGGFKSPEEFVARGEEVLPIVRSQNKELERKLQAAEERAERLERESTEKLARIEKMSRVALDKQREKLQQEYEARMDAAAEVGDVAQVRTLRKESRDALDEFDKKASEEPEKKADGDKPQLPSHITTAISNWVEENEWFKTDEEMNRVANLRHEKLLKEKPGLSITENLEEVRAYVAKRYPEKFAAADDDDDDEDEPKPRGSRVEGGARVNGSGAKSAWSQLPADAKAQADKFIKSDGLFLEKGETAEKNLTQARERYAKQYLEIE